MSGARAPGKSESNDSPQCCPLSCLHGSSDIALQAAIQVRNRLVSAYHDVMNMQI